jgi:hypothetical protein
MFGAAGLSAHRSVSLFWNALWTEFVKCRTIRVPEDIRNLRLAMKLAEALNAQLDGSVAFTEADPLVVRIGCGEHHIEDAGEFYPAGSDRHCLHLPISNMHLVGVPSGSSAEETTTATTTATATATATSAAATTTMTTVVRGAVAASDLSGVVFKNITFTHPPNGDDEAFDAMTFGAALSLGGHGDASTYRVEQCVFQNSGAAGLQLFAATVTVVDCTVASCDSASAKSFGGGLRVSCGGTYSFTRCRFVDNHSCGAYLMSCVATFTDCLFRGNGHHGLRVWMSAEVHLDGLSTEVLENRGFGVCTAGSIYPGGGHPTDGDRWPGGVVYVHLPAKHASIHGHGGEHRDKFCGNGRIVHVEDDGLLGFGGGGVEVKT